MRDVLRSIIIALPLAVLFACAEVPQEAVTLSVTVGKDLEELRRSHKAAVTTLFDHAKKDANRFINEVYRPALIKRFFDTFQFAGKDMVTVIREEIAKPGAGDTVEIMAIVVEEVTAQVEERRQKLIAPIEAQEASSLAAIEDAYANVIAGHAVVTAHLSSIRKVQEAQNEFLADIGLADLRKKVVDKTTKISDTVGELFSKAQNVSGAIDKLDGIIDEAKATLSKL